MLTRYMHLLCFGLLLVCTSWSIAQQAADEQLLSLAKTAYERRLWAEVETQAMTLRAQYPQSQAVGEATVLLFRALEYLHEPERMEALRQEVLTRWPQTNLVWQVIEADFTIKMRTDRDAAIQQLTMNLTHPALTPSGRTRALGLLLTTLASVNPDLFVARAVPAVTDIEQHKTPDELVVYADIAQRLYRPLFERKQWEVARTINQRCQQVYRQAKAPADMLQADATAYYSALAGVAPDRVLAMLPQLPRQLDKANAAQDIIGAAALVRTVYPLLYRAQGLEAVDLLHTQISTALTRLNNPDGCMQADFQAYGQILEQADPERFHALAAQEAVKITSVKTIQEAAPLVTTSLRLYTSLLGEGKYADAVSLRDRNDAELRRIGVQYYVYGYRYKNHMAYYDTLTSVDPERALTEAVAALRTTEQITSNIEARFATDLARRAYLPLLKRQRGEEARQIHQQLQIMLRRLRDPDATSAVDQKTYFTALQQIAPEAYLNEGVSAITALDAVTPDMYHFPQQALAYLGKEFASQLYLPLVKAGRLTDARTVLTHIMSAIERMGDSSDMRVTNLSSYLRAIEPVAQDEYVQLTAQVADTAYASLKQVTRSSEITYPMQLARDVLYRPLSASQRIPEAQQLHRALYAAAEQAHIPARDLITAEMNDYLKFCAGVQPEVAYDELLTWVTIAQHDETLIACQDLASISRDAAPMVFAYLLRVKRQADAAALSTELQKLLCQRPQTTFQALQARVAYLVELAPYAPDDFLKQSEADIAAMTPTSPADEMRERSKLVRAAYSSLLLAGRLQEAIALHTHMQNIVQASSIPDVRDADNQAYANALSNNAVELIFKRFQDALAAKQNDESQKWLAILNTMAYEHPRAVEARKLMRATTVPANSDK